MRSYGIIDYHISSSIWSGIKHHIPSVTDNTCWQLGKGVQINFWTDSWVGDPLVDLLDIPRHYHALLQAKVAHFIANDHWLIPHSITSSYPNLVPLLNSVTIPISKTNDELRWIHSDSGVLSFKDAYLFHRPIEQHIPWAKIIWCDDIPPSKSCLMWRIMHNRLPTDDLFSRRGCYIVSKCDLCGEAAETIHHIFCDCCFSKDIWHWFASVLSLHVVTSTVSSIFDICNKNWNSQCKTVVISAVVNIFNTIWWCRNQHRFEGKSIHWRSAVNSIISNVSLSGNLSKKASFISMQEFIILKAFNVNVHHPKAPVIKEVLWQPPLYNWVKCNTDGSALGSPSLASCGGIFRDYTATFLGGFSINIGNSYALHAELIGVMNAIEIAHSKGWNKLWIESDSQLVNLAFKSDHIVPWKLRNRWFNCLTLTKTMHFRATHIYREGNCCADRMAALGINVNGFYWWDNVPPSVQGDYISNLMGLPSFRFH
ncbi:unnamed protein product [Trifolium pratense]|uniref:Uncharacterized protein n=1 Tax=Trifolium pratense TaxID=57577 RepID=A0ACB0JIG3_TRIPR|nr:unnamed protein product [Trifolium pratense]